MSTAHNSSDPQGAGGNTRHHARVGALAALAVCLVALLAALAGDLVSGAVKVLCLFAACAVVALIVVILPTRFRTTAGSFAAAFVAAAGVLPVFLSSEDPAPSPSPNRAQVHADYLAELVRRGPFTEQLPPPLRVDRLRDVRISDPSASARLDAVWVDVDTSAEEGLSVFALIEVYPSPSAAAKRKGARIALHRRLYPDSRVYDNCFDELGGHGGGWTCVAVRGHAFAEVAVSPSDTAHMGLATGTLTALLRYTDRLTKVAS